MAGVYARGEGHAEAVPLLARADQGAAKHLGVLLSLKAKAGYSHGPIRSQDIRRASRAVLAQIETAER